jgi:outer membrane scaffolding protein for murein synthesis (MipA/OmpV family)
MEARDPGRHRGFALEPRLALARRPAGEGWSYGLSVSALLGDRRLGSTFYAVAPDEVRPDRAAYAARAGLMAWRFGATGAAQLTPDLRLFVFGRVDSVAGAANRDSPLVRRTTGASVGLGLTYTLARSSTPAGD